jgi:hypothetical protein
MPGRSSRSQMAPSFRPGQRSDHRAMYCTRIQRYTPTRTSLTGSGSSKTRQRPSLRRRQWLPPASTFTYSVQAGTHGMFPGLLPLWTHQVLTLSSLISSPGRFLAVQEMKLMFSLLLLRYDMKLAPGTKPKCFHIATMAVPDTKLPVLFRARA